MKDPTPKPDAEPADPLSADLIRKVLRRDVANIALKVKGGVPLKASERALLNSSIAGQELPATVGTQRELAKLLDISQPQICEWLKRPGNPGRKPNGDFDVNAWLLWPKPVARTGLSEQDPRAKELLKRTVQDNELKAIQIAEKRGQLISIDLARRDILRAAVATRQKFLAAGRTGAQEIAIKLGATPDQILAAVAHMEFRVRDCLKEFLTIDWGSEP